MGLHILAVCTGNICRSPLMELLLLRGLEQRLGADRAGVTVASAGTLAMNGDPMEPAALRAARSLGLQTAGEHRSRRLTPAVLADVDLVLCAAREHRTAVVTAAPHLLRRTFTLRELARLAALVARPGPTATPSGQSGLASAPADAQVVLSACYAARGPARVANPADDDVPDPIGRPDEVHDQVGRQIDEAVDAVLARLIPQVLT